jgi:hypothetical protein
MKKVLVTTKHRGVFAGLISPSQDLLATSMPLMAAKMAIRWRTSRGVMELAESGPNEKSLISAQADIPMLHDITAVFSITEGAWEKWLRA